MPPGAADGLGGVFLSLLTESFAVRALLGSLAAAGLAAWVVRSAVVRSTGGRRLLVLAPVLAAAAAALSSLISVDEAYLPQLWLATGDSRAAGSVLAYLRDMPAVSVDRGIDVLLLGYGLSASVLVARRLLGAVRVRRLLAVAVPADDRCPAVVTVARLSRRMGLRTPRVLLLGDCPGGAFTVGVRRALVAVDPALFEQLDERELEGLLAHELAHVARRDGLVQTLVGVCRDLTFFLPSVHLAARWLRREQEESADEVASAVTRRPAALASSILKVWDRSRRLPAGRLSCTAVPLAPRRLAFAGIGAPARPQLSEAAQAVAARVERLLDGPPAVTAVRRAAELTLAMAVLGAASGAALVLPGWIATELNTYSLSFIYLAEPAEQTVDSPAFATFRWLAPVAVAPTDSVEAEIAATRPVRPVPAGAASPSAGCPCVESQAQLALGVSTSAPPVGQRMLWRSDGHDAWELNEAPGQARALWTLGDARPRMGFFLISPSS